MKRLVFSILIILLWCGTASSQSFEIEQVPPDESLNAATSAGRGLSMAINAEGLPYFSAYNSEGKLVLIEKLNGAWTFTAITDDIVDGIISDQYETSITIVESEPVIVYYDGSNGNLQLAVRNNNSWTTSTIDDGSHGGNDVGGYAEIHLQTNGEIRICYTDNSDGDLMLADGNLTDGFTTQDIDTDDGAWCSFIADNEFLYSQSGNIRLATFANNSWTTSDTGMDGVLPTGGYNSDGSLEYFATQVKTNYGNNGVSDNTIKGYYKANGGSGSIYDDDGGAYPSFVENVGKAFRYLRYSALFGNSSSVSATVLQPDGVYKYSIHVGDFCLPIIRHVTMAASLGLRHVAYYYDCDGEEVIQYATLEIDDQPADDGGDTDGGDSGTDDGGSGSSDSGDSGSSGGSDDGAGESTGGDSDGSSGDENNEESPDEEDGGDEENSPPPSLEDIAEDIGEIDPEQNNSDFIEDAKEVVSELKSSATSKAVKKLSKKTLKLFNKIAKQDSGDESQRSKKQVKRLNKFWKKVKRLLNKLLKKSNKNS